MAEQAVRKRRSTEARANGQPAESALAEAIAHEQILAEEAKRIWAYKTELTPEVFLELLPLLRKPIPAGFIVSTPSIEGKPYPSTGIKSLQVQIDRLDNVLTPLCWGWRVEYADDGKLAHVTAWIGDPDRPLVKRSAHGGVNRASTIGNLFKGSETNAAKLAFARLGPGHEVYLGATDLDPDVSEDAAKAQEGPVDGARKLPPEKVTPLVEAVGAAGLTDHLPAKLRGFGVSKIEELTVEQAVSLYEWTKAEVTGS